MSIIDRLLGRTSEPQMTRAPAEFIAEARSRAVGARTQQTGMGAPAPARPRMPAPPAAPAGPSHVAADQNYDAREDARDQLFAQTAQMLAEQRQGETLLANKQLIKQQMLRQMDPVSDIDQQLRDNARQSVAFRAILDERYRDLSPAQRRQVVGDQLQNFADAEENLMSVRQARLDAVDSVVDEQVQNALEQQQALKNTSSLMKMQLQNLKDSGADDKTQFQMWKMLEDVDIKREQLEKKNMKRGIVGANSGGGFDIDQFIAQTGYAPKAKWEVDFLAGRSPEARAVYARQALLKEDMNKANLNKTLSQTDYYEGFR